MWIHSTACLHRIDYIDKTETINIQLVWEKEQAQGTQAILWSVEEKKGIVFIDIVTNYRIQ